METPNNPQPPSGENKHAHQGYGKKKPNKRAPVEKSKKKRHYTPLLPGTSIEFQTEIRSYHGIFNNFGVWIPYPSHYKDLIRSGFFGKGILSRSIPLWNVSSNNNNSQIVQREGGFHRARTRKKRKVEMEAIIPSSENHQQQQQQQQQQQLFNGDVEEFLQLSVEEAFFLLYGLECITIHTPQGKVMSVEECWKQFKEVNPRFVELYVCYHHYRREGWVPKSGIKYGVDWILYQKGPSFYHAQKAVICCVVDSDSKEFESNQRELSLLNLLNANRVSEHVRKGLSLCYIHKSSNFKDDNSPDSALDHFRVEEVEVGRWLPTKNRE